MIKLIPQAVSASDIAGILICLLVGFPITAFGIIGFFLGFGLQHFRADGVAQTLTLRRGIEGFGKRESFPLNRIAAVPLCSKVNTRAEGGGHSGRSQAFCRLSRQAPAGQASRDT
jgi:hypothetical protein